MKSIRNFINGTFEDPLSGGFLPNYEPSSGTVYTNVARSDYSDLERAVSAASNAFDSWSLTPIEERSRILIRLADLIEKHLDDLALAESVDTGKPLSLARRIDIPRAAANFRFFGSAVVNFSTSAHLNEGQNVNYTRRAPLGVVGCISPWNLPLYLFTWKIAPALAMGNCVIGKPSELTPVTASMLGNLANEAGLPPGVLNILHGKGDEIGQAIVNHPCTKAISFTGGTSTGEVIASSCAKSFKKVSLELGGKNPTLVFADCNLEAAVEGAVKSSFTNQGEICLCGSRIMVEHAIYEEFKARFIQHVERLKVGHPQKEEADLGALISEEHLQKVKGFIQRAEEDGGRILTGGRALGGDGYFLEPTVIENADPNCEINQTEVFGPVVSLMPFDSEASAIRMANATKYGLAAGIWTSDVRRAHAVAHALSVGIVWINCWMVRDLRTPFGGMNASGLGREGGDEALRFFSEVQNVCIQL